VTRKSIPQRLRVKGRGKRQDKIQKIPSGRVKDAMKGSTIRDEKLKGTGHFLLKQGKGMLLLFGEGNTKEI